MNHQQRNFKNIIETLNNPNESISINIHRLMSDSDISLEVDKKYQFLLLLNYLHDIVRDGDFLINFITQLIVDCKRLTEENKHSFHFKYNSSGKNKSCFECGDYVLTIGYPADTLNLFYTEQFLAPIIEYYHEASGLQIGIRLKADTDHILEDDVISCFDYEFQHDRLYLDCILENLGKYMDDFTHPYKDSSDLGKKFLGLEKYDLSDRKKGEVAIIDCDKVIDINEDMQMLSEEESKQLKLLYQKKLIK